LTVDTESLTQKTVTLRQRDSRQQERIEIKNIKINLNERYHQKKTEFIQKIR
jgi:glycyl-tRNA synthetase (class II)